MMPRCPPKDYQDRCKAVELDQQGLTRREIAATLQRPERWVYRTLSHYEAEIGLESLRDRSSRPQHSPQRTPAEIEQVICELKQAHPVWGRRQICKQLRWRWREDPARLGWVSEGRVRCVLARHPELIPPVPPEERAPPRQIDYLDCNLLWGADIHQTRLPDGSIWETLHWLDLYSRYELGQVTAARLSEDMVISSFLAVAKSYGLPLILKSDRDKLFHDANSALPSRLTRLLTALGVYHLLIPKKQPWWNGVVERYIRTCREEVHLPSQGEATLLNQSMEEARRFYNQERCHSGCNDQPPVTCYQPSPRRVPQDFALEQVPITFRPTVVTRKVYSSGRVSLAGHSFYFSQRYAAQTITVTVAGWSAVGQAQDGWQRHWDLRPAAEQPPAEPLPPPTPKPLTRKVNRRGCICLKGYHYYVGMAWAGLTLPIQRQGDSWQVSLPDGSAKHLPQRHLFPQSRHQPGAEKAKTPRPEPPEPTAFQTRRVTKTGQISFHHHLYYVGSAHQGETVYVAPTPEALGVYSTDYAWIKSCPWKTAAQPDKPLCPT